MLKIKELTIKIEYSILEDNMKNINNFYQKK